MRRAKIVCTIGPATESAEQIQALVDAGMDVARLNRSHGDTEVHERVYNNVRAAAKASGRSVAVLVDLQGPKIRLGKFVQRTCPAPRTSSPPPTRVCPTTPAWATRS